MAEFFFVYEHHCTSDNTTLTTKGLNACANHFEQECTYIRAKWTTCLRSANSDSNITSDFCLFTSIMYMTTFLPTNDVNKRHSAGWEYFAHFFPSVLHIATFNLNCTGLSLIRFQMASTYMS